VEAYQIWTNIWDGEQYGWERHYRYIALTDGEILSVAAFGSREKAYYRYVSGILTQIAYDTTIPVRITFVSENSGLSQGLSLIAEAITNMADVYASIGFDPKVYLAEGFQKAISDEVKRLFDVIHHKYCSCPSSSAVNTPVDTMAEHCTPFGLAAYIPAPYETSRGTDCHESLDVISWTDWAKQYYYDKFQDWTHCGTLFVINDGDQITKDQWSQGNYNSLLDIAEFERITATGTPWRYGAPVKGEAAESWVTDAKMHHRIGGINERWFYQTLMRNVIIELRAMAKKKAGQVDGTFYSTDRKVLELFLGEFGTTGLGFNINNIVASVRTLLASSAYIEDLDAQNNVELFIASAGFRGLMLKLHNGITQAIRSGMLDKYGNIVNFSLRNEIVQVSSILEFTYG
jgi:hypothetical protein